MIAASVMKQLKIQCRAKVLQTSKQLEVREKSSARTK